MFSIYVYSSFFKMWTCIPSAPLLLRLFLKTSEGRLSCCRAITLGPSKLSDALLKSHLGRLAVKFQSDAPSIELKQEPLGRDGNPVTKSLKVAIIGRPNAGKSTLINQLIGHQVCPVSMKAHCTRIKARAFQTEGDTQLIYLDTPGLVNTKEVEKFKFDLDFLRSGEDALSEADIIGVLIDVSNKYEGNNIDPTILRMLCMYYRKASFLILNKVDALKDKKHLLHVVERMVGDEDSKKKFPLPERPLSEAQVVELVRKTPVWPHFREVFMVSALEGDGVGDIKAFLCENAKPGKWLIPEPFSVHTAGKHVIGFVKAAILDYFKHEVPYSVEVKLGDIGVSDGKLYAEVTVLTKSKRHKTIVASHVVPVSRIAAANVAGALKMPSVVRINVQERK